MLTDEIRLTKKDGLYQDAIGAVVDGQKASISFLQRKLLIGYNHAARLLEAMEYDGIVSPTDREGKRAVLVTPNV